MKNVLTLLTIIVGSNVWAQIDECTGYNELYRGRHKVDGMSYGHPYTTFDRHNQVSFIETLSRIRVNIANSPMGDDNPVRIAYKTAYDNAILSRPTLNSENGLYQTTSSGRQSTVLPFWGKNNAFVFLIGLDGQGRNLDSLDPTGATRNAFRDRAIEAVHDPRIRVACVCRNTSFHS